MEILEFIESIKERDFSDKDGECKMTIGEFSNDKSIETVEKGIEIQLPSDYKEFVKNYGDSNFFGVNIRDPFDLYRYGPEALEMEGFIAFACDAFGNNFAFDKSLKIVKCSHDPFGYGKISDSFTEWTKIHYDFIEKLSGGKEDWEHQYIKTEKEIEQSWLRMKKEFKSIQPKKWWQFWK